MSLPVISVHDPIANPVTGADLSADQVREVEAEIRELKRETSNHNRTWMAVVKTPETHPED